MKSYKQFKSLKESEDFETIIGTNNHIPEPPQSKIIPQEKKDKLKSLVLTADKEVDNANNISSMIDATKSLLKVKNYYESLRRYDHDRDITNDWWNVKLKWVEKLKSFSQQEQNDIQQILDPNFIPVNTKPIKPSIRSEMDKYNL